MLLKNTNNDFRLLSCPTLRLGVALAGGGSNSFEEGATPPLLARHDDKELGSGNGIL
jgi:hypothetical protein